MGHFVNVEDLSSNQVMHLIDRAIAYKKGEVKHVTGHVVNMFYENSTRTKHSFEMAQYRLGMHIINFEVQTSSVQKGESLYDSLLTMKALGVDTAVIRPFDDNYYEPLMNLGINIVNAGSGCGSHPSQSLLDMMTIYEEFGNFESLTVAIIGDLVHSRVAHSNMQLLKALGARVLLVGPKWYFNERMLQWGEYVDIETAIEISDVVMMLRVQLERHDDVMLMSAEGYHESYGLSLERQKRMKPHAIIMHPAPVNRNVEIADALVECSQSRIVRQMENGVYMRMAILESVMEG